MFRLKSIICVIFILFLTGCYESEITVEINRDGSGTMTSQVDFDNATDEQRQQIKAMLNSPNARSNFNRKSIEENYPNPYFEIIELQEDQENLRFRLVIKFQDINRLFAVDPQTSQLKGVDFKVDGDRLVFKIVKSSQSMGFGTNAKFAGKGDSPNLNIYPKEIIRFVNADSKDRIEFVYEYTGEDVVWENTLSIPGHTIQKNLTKYNFADYPVLSPMEADVIKASWSRSKHYNNSLSKSYLELKLKVGLPLSGQSDFLGYDKVYLLSGQYSNGTEFELVDIWHKGFQSFNDENNLAGKNSFKLPLNFSFPDSPVAWLDETKVRIRLVRGQDLNRVELGSIQPNHTYEHNGLKLTTGEIDRGGLSLDIAGPIYQLDDVLVKTKRGNVFPLDVSSSSSRSDDQLSARYWEFLPLNELTLLADIYDSSDYVWLDVVLPKMDLKLQGDGDKSVSEKADVLSSIFPEIKKFPDVPENVYKDKDAFVDYWKTLNIEQIIPALLTVSYNLEKIEKSDLVYMSYQIDLGKFLQARPDLNDIDKKEIAEYLFDLFLSMPDQNASTAMIHLLANGGLLDSIRERGFNALKDGKFKNGIDSFFKQELSDDERFVLRDVFQKSDDWMERFEILGLLTKGTNPDLALAQNVLSDQGNDNLVRKKALEILIDRKKNISAKEIEPNIINPKTRDQTLSILQNRLGRHRSSDQISKEKMIMVLQPLISVFEDLAEQEEDYKADKAKKILEVIR